MQPIMWILESTEATFRLKPGAIKTVGRAPRADFILDVADLSSTNGTFVNDKRIDKARLKTGDRLRIGRVELMVNLQPKKKT
jgi:hypothetical protein